MSKFLKYTAFFITLVFTVILVATLYVANLDPNDHKDWIAGKFEESTGLALSLDGEIGITFYPWLGVTVNDVTVHNAPGFSTTPLLQAQRAEFRARLLPLLDREYEIDTIHLRGARVHLETSATGEKNWAASADPAGESAASVNADPLLNNLVIGGVDIQDAAITFDDRFNDRRIELANITVATGELVYGDPVNLSLGLDASTSRPALSSRVDLTGTVNYDLDNQRYDLAPLALTGTLAGDSVPDGSADFSLTTAASIDFASDTLTLRDFSLSALDAQVNANVNGAGLSGDSPLYQVNLAAAGTDLAVLFRILDNAALVAQIDSLNSSAFRFNALLESRPAQGSLAVTGLEASLLDATITGEITLENLQSGTPSLSGAINAAGPDLPTLLEVAGQFQGGSNSELARYGRELQQSPDQGFLLNTRFDADLAVGTVDLPAFEAELLGASMSGNLTARSLNTDSPVLQGRLNASGPDMPLMLQIAGQVSGGRESPLNQLGRQLRNVPNRNFTVVAPFDINMGNGNIDLRGLDASFLGLRLSSSLQASNFQAAGGSMRGDINLSGRNLAGLLGALEQPDLAEVLQSFSLAVSVNGPRTSLALDPLALDLVLSGPRIPNSPVTLSLNAASLVDMENESLRTDNFSLAGLGLDLSGSVNASDFSGDLDFSGQLTLPAFNLRRFMQQLNQALPPTADDTVFRALAVDTAFSGSRSDLRLSNLDFTLDDSRFTGDFTAAGLNDPDTPPALDFDLAVGSLDLDRYAAPAGDATAASEAGDTELPVETLRSLNLDGDLTVDRLTWSGLNLQDIVLSVSADDGVLALSPMRANLYGGSYSGDIRLDVTGETPVARVDSSLTRINLEPLMVDFMGASYASGTGNITVSLTGRGANVASIKSSLNGSGAVELQDGVLQGVDVGSVLRQVEIMIREGRTASIARGERTPFETFSATIGVANGIVTTNDMLMESSGFDVTGRGTLANLANDTIAFNLVANVDETPASTEQAYDIGGYALPIACTGALASPRCLPDIQAIIAGAIGSAVRQGITDLLQRAVGADNQEQAPDEPATQDNNLQEEQGEQEQQTTDPREELLQRAIENIFNR